MQVEEVQDSDCGKVERIEEGKGRGGGDRRKRLDRGKGMDIGTLLYRKKIGDTSHREGKG
jgi:hypothetical protein